MGVDASIALKPFLVKQAEAGDLDRQVYELGYTAGDLNPA